MKFRKMITGQRQKK